MQVVDLTELSRQNVTRGQRSSLHCQQGFAREQGDAEGLPVLTSLRLKISKLPNLKKVGAMRSTADALSLMGSPVYSGSRTIIVSEVIMLPALVVGIPCGRNIGKHSAYQTHTRHLEECSL